MEHDDSCAKSSQATSLPTRAMFDKTNRLLASSDNIIPKPSGTDGLYIVPGHSNTIHVVTPGKGGGGYLKCDRFFFMNTSTRICD